MQSLEQIDVPRFAHLIRRFHRAVDLQNKRDAGIFAAVVRTLKAPKGNGKKDVAMFTNIVRAIVKQELEKSTCSR